MKKDRFEDFVTKNREAFDSYTPGTNVWDRIESNLGKPKGSVIKINWRSNLIRAAAVVILFITAFGVHDYFLYKVEQNKTSEIPELKEAEGYYSRMVGNKMDEVKPLLSKYPDINQELTKELTELDSIYNDLKGDLKDNISNEEIVEALIENYKLRVELLQEILDELQDMKSNKSPYDKQHKSTNDENDEKYEI
jgi:hypothetical protein